KAQGEWSSRGGAVGVAEPAQPLSFNIAQLDPVAACRNGITRAQGGALCPTALERGFHRPEFVAPFPRGLRQVDMLPRVRRQVVQLELRLVVHPAPETGVQSQ